MTSLATGNAKINSSMKKDGDEVDATKIINRTMDFLQRKYPQDKHVDVIICEGYGYIEGPDGNTGFGVFDSEAMKIYIATDVPDPESSLVETTAHEYRHFMQLCEDQPFDEEEAEAFALYIAHLMNKESNV